MMWGGRDIKDCYFRLGMPEELVRALLGYYREVECRFAIGNTLGQVFRKTSGVFQGDPFSMLLILGLTAVWAEAAHRCGCVPHGYVDDLTPTAAGEEAGERLLAAAADDDVHGRFLVVVVVRESVGLAPAQRLSR